MIPYLVEALGEESSELRFRAVVLLDKHSSYQDVAPHLAQALDMPYGERARAILRRRSLQQVAIACQPRNAEKLLHFWGTDPTKFRDEFLLQLAKAQTGADAARVIEPLVGLDRKAASFGDALSRLELLQLSYDHRHGAGFVIADTLAHGWSEDREVWTAFAWQYLEALETLAEGMRQRSFPAAAVRQEVSQRADASQGAARYLVEILNETSQARVQFGQAVSLSPASLEQEFCRGVAAVDSAPYQRGVGRVHIVQMLTEALGKWPDAPRAGVIQQMIDGVVQTLSTGNKPKALSFLDALDACRDVSHHRLDVRSGLGRRFAERLYLAAQQAPDNRVYYAARMTHDRLMALIDMEGPSSPDTFPRQMCEAYLQGAAEATADPQRLGLERYLRILQRLQATNLGLQRPGVMVFVTAMRDQVTAQPESLTQGLAELDRLLRLHQAVAGGIDAQRVEQDLQAWCMSRQLGPQPTRVAPVQSLQ